MSVSLGYVCKPKSRQPFEERLPIFCVAISVNEIDCYVVVLFFPS
jgi:hypothetical protein